MPTTNQRAASSRPEPSEADIQKKAYHLWIEGGCLEGVELDNWLSAKELLRHRPEHATHPFTGRTQTGGPAHRPLETL